MHPLLRGPVPMQLVPVVPPKTTVKPALQAPTSDLIIGLDLGALTDPTAAALMRRSIVPDPAEQGQHLRTPRGRLVRRFDVLALRRFPIGTSYVDIVKHIKGQADRFPSIRLCVDASGVGRPVVDMFRDLLLPVESITITGGNSWSRPEHDEWHVSKIQLVGCGRALLELGQIKVARGVTDAETLRRELLDFKVHISKSANEIYAAREGSHDDLVLSVLLPTWWSWIMDQSGPFIVGHSKVDPIKMLDAKRLSTTATSRLFGGVGRGGDRQGQLPSPTTYGSGS